MSPFSGSSLLATGRTSFSVNSRACSWIIRRSSVMYGMALRIPETDEVGAFEIDDEVFVLVEALGMPGDDAEALVRVRDAPIQHYRLRAQRIAGIDVLVEGELVDAEERPAAFAQILHREAEGRGEDQHRIGDQARMAVRLGKGGIEIVRVEMQRQRRELRALGLGDGATPRMLEDP